LRSFVDIARFRKGPEDLPVSRAVLGWCIVAGIVLRALISRSLPMPYKGNVLAILGIDTATTLLFVALVLAAVRRPERYLQTASAIFGIQLVMLPVIVAASWLLSAFQSDPFWSVPVLALTVAVDVWGLVIVARILRSATDWSLAACIGLAILSDLLTFSVMSLLFPLNVALPAQA
jgi:hypothetical protein